MEIIIAFLSQSTSPLNITSSYIQWMNSLSNIVSDIQTMSTQSRKQCPSCKCWFTTQKSFKHHIRHCMRTNCEETLNDLAFLLLTNVFQQSNLTQLYEDEYDNIQKIEDFVASIFDSDSWVNNNEELKKDMDDNTSLVQPQI